MFVFRDVIPKRINFSDSGLDCFGSSTVLPMLGYFINQTWWILRLVVSVHSNRKLRCSYMLDTSASISNNCSRNQYKLLLGSSVLRMGASFCMYWLIPFVSQFCSLSFLQNILVLQKQADPRKSRQPARVWSYLSAPFWRWWVRRARGDYFERGKLN